MQKISWNTIWNNHFENFVINNDELLLESKKILDDIKVHCQINKLLEDMETPEHGDFEVDMSNFDISSVCFDTLPKITLEDNFELCFVDDSRVSSPSGGQKILQSEKGDSTSTSTQRQLNLELLDDFDKRKATFVYLLRHTNFEDGLDNEATDFFNALFEKDPCISLFWLNGVYTDNMTDKAVIEGILRIVSLLDAPEYRKYILPLVKASFNDKNVAIQEAAIMVAEKWRNKMCLEALQTTCFASKWIRKYANQVIYELKEELAHEISEDD